MLNGSKILITGGTGSWGNQLTRQLLDKYNVAEIRIYSRGEHKQVEMKRRFRAHDNIRFVIGDIRDKNILDLTMKGIDYVFHLAALKHVPVCEENNWEAVLTNIYGTQNVIEGAIKNNVKKVIDISTDKAVDPYNLYGVTKACGEKLILNAQNNYITDTRFVCIRGGNVMGTNGSVLPLFVEQLKNSNRLTVTDEAMTRYLMSTKEAIGLIFSAVEESVGGEIFVMRMPALSVGDIVKAMVHRFGNPETSVEIIGARPGEKLHEVLVSKNEIASTVEYSHDYYVILPSTMTAAHTMKYGSLAKVSLPEFTSENARRLKQDEFISKIEGEEWLNAMK